MNIHRWIEANVPQNGIVIEAGSWDAADTQFFSDHLQTGKVYSFEPFPEFYKQSYARLQGRANAEIYPYALSEKTQSYTLYISELNGKSWCSNSILKPKEHLVSNPHITFDKQIDVQGINLDDFVCNKAIERIDFMWLDIQGAEHSVLKSAPQTLKRLKYLYSEVSLIETYENVVLYAEFKQFMAENGFELVYEDLPHKDMGDALFMNRAI